MFLYTGDSERLDDDTIKYDDTTIRYRPWLYLYRITVQLSCYRAASWCVAREEKRYQVKSCMGELK